METREMVETGEVGGLEEGVSGEFGEEGVETMT